MIIDGKQIKEKYLNLIKEEIRDKKITLAVIQVGNDEASSVYVKQKEKMCAQIGANFNHYIFDVVSNRLEYRCHQLSNLLLQVTVHRNRL